MALSFVQLNVEGDKHLVELKRLLSTHPDVLTMQEVFRVDAESLAHDYRYHCCFAPEIIFDTPGADFNPRGEWGSAILTKANQDNFSLSYYRYQADDVISQLTSKDHPRALLSCDIKVDGVTYTFATLHFTWAMPQDADRFQKADLGRLMVILDQFPSFVLAGDFNAPRGGLVQTKLAHRYQYYIPDNIETTIDNALHRAAPLYLVVDHLFATADYTISNVKVESGYSDHCAIFATIDKLTS